MNAHVSTVYSARNSGSCARGMTATTLSDSPCLMFVLLRQAHVPLGHYTNLAERVSEGASDTHLITRTYTFDRAELLANVEPKRICHSGWRC